MANYKTGAQRHNDRMSRIFENAHKIERERLAHGEEPNPSLTSPEEAKKYGYHIHGRTVTKMSKKKEMAKKMKHA